MHAVLNMAFTVISCLILLAVIAGAGLYLAQRRRVHANPPNALRHLPRQWPLHPRPLTNTAEQKVWHWLQQVFPGHHVMIKLPVTRFTSPNARGAVDEWFPVLSGTYFTYVVCDLDGTVIGCADLLGPRGLPQASRELRQTLLAQCGIGYWVLDPDALPAAAELRADCIPDAHPDEDSAPYLLQPVAGKKRLERVAEHLHQVLRRNRTHRPLLRSARSSGTAAGDAPVTSPPSWTQQDSFLAMLDNRRAQKQQTAATPAG